MKQLNTTMCIKQNYITFDIGLSMFKTAQMSIATLALFLEHTSSILLLFHQEATVVHQKPASAQSDHEWCKIQTRDIAE